MKDLLSALLIGAFPLIQAWGDDPMPSAPGKATAAAYDPQHIDLSKSSTLGNKSFSFTASNLAEQKNLDDDKHRTFPTTTFASSQARPSSLQNQSAHVTASSAFSSKAAGFDKPYATTSFTTHQTSFLAQQPASALQNKSSDLAHTSPYATSANSALKPYVPETPEDSSVLEKNKNTVLTRMSTVPNRPLTIEEVRDLINHGVGPYGDNSPDRDHKIVDDGSDLTPPPATSAPKSAPALTPASLRAPALDKETTH